MDTASQQLWLIKKNLEKLDWAYSPLNYLQIYLSAFSECFYCMLALTGRLSMLLHLKETI